MEVFSNLEPNLSSPFPKTQLAPRTIAVTYYDFYEKAVCQLDSKFQLCVMVVSFSSKQKLALIEESKSV